MHITPFHRRTSSRWTLLAVAAAVATATLTACGGGSTGGSPVAAAPSATNRVSQAASSTAATSGSDSGIYGPDSDSPPCNLVTRQQLASTLQHEVTHLSTVGGACIATGGSDPSWAYSFKVDNDPSCWSRATLVAGTSVPGIGDAAIGNGLGLSVKHGSTCISTGGGHAAEQSGDFSQDIAVAQILLGKLG